MDIDKIVNTIYCDEAGFTGNDLYNPDQPHFVYSSVLIDPLEAAEVVKKIIIDFNIKSEELKGAKLLKTNRGRNAIIWLLENYNQKALLIAFDKRYSLSGKFYEYVFEPILAPHSSIFYNILFHRFISNVLYLHLLAQQQYTENLLLDFQASIRSLDLTLLENSLSISSSVDIAPFLRQILTFAVYHKEAICHELMELRKNTSTGNWVLELSLTALHSLLTKWGEIIHGMEVYCDESKPIVTYGDFLDVMINRQDRMYIQIGMKSYPITFNLSGPIQTISSKECPGIQIADVFASSIAYSLKENDGFSQQCRVLCNNIIHPNSVFPQLEYVNLSEPQGYINALVLSELVDRSLNNQNLFDGMLDYIENIKLLFPKWRQNIKNKPSVKRDSKREKRGRRFTGG